MPSIVAAGHDAAHVDRQLVPLSVFTVTASEIVPGVASISTVATRCVP
jgi:hypothetical protein